MISLILGAGFALLALLGAVLLKAYHHLPFKELKRRARRGDANARLLFKPAAYGSGLTTLLWVATGVAFAISIVLLAEQLPAWLAVIVAAIIVWLGFGWIPATRQHDQGMQLAVWASPALAWMLERLQPALQFIEKFVAAHRPVTIHTGLYEKTDLVELLAAQKQQPDSRIAPDEIDLLTHALSFGDKQVLDALVPKRVVVSVSAAELIGPKLMDELHQSGHSRFPVYDGKKDNIVGILYLRDLVGTKKTGPVSGIMKRRLAYVHEDFTLQQTLQAFLKTKQHLFLVVNSFEELTGIITIEDVIEQIIGQPILDEFDQYDDLRAVAAAAAKKDHAAHEKAQAEPEASAKLEKVVE